MLHYSLVLTALSLEGEPRETINTYILKDNTTQETIKTFEVEVKVKKNLIKVQMLDDLE